MKCRMVSFTLASGHLTAIGMAGVSKYGKMVQSTKATGKTIKQMARVDSFMLMEMFMKEIGRMTRLMDVVFMNTMMEPDLLVTGRTIGSTVLESRLGPMALTTKVVMSSGRNMVWVLSNGLITANSSVSFTTTIFTEKVFTSGLITVAMKVNGVPTKCMVKAHSPG